MRPLTPKKLGITDVNDDNKGIYIHAKNNLFFSPVIITKTINYEKGEIVSATQFSMLFH